MLGKVTKGLDVVKKATEAGHDGAFDPQPGGGHPKKDILIKTMTVAAAGGLTRGTAVKGRAARGPFSAPVALGDVVLDAVRARHGDEEAAALLPACGADTVRALLPELEHAVKLTATGPAAPGAAAGPRPGAARRGRRRSDARTRSGAE